MSELELQEIAETWIKLYYLREGSKERQENFWAYSKLTELSDDAPEVFWKVIHLIRKFDGSDVLLANLAAGPVEDLLAKHGSSFIDRVEALAQEDAQFKKILGAVWQQDDMPDVIWQSIKPWLVRRGECLGGGLERRPRDARAAGICKEIDYSSAAQ